ncbi:unnamed protein product [Cylindrotheca closterium]|uniref:Uncharacterized protein n=1 Tax=Cylindrotheca closterium TaxID=2856 RepID=A0AAD2CEU9_9STRA|nr:unnamed protein product [Cylindrotheca closterium]
MIRRMEYDDASDSSSNECSEAFIIDCESCDSSVSSISMYDLDDLSSSSEEEDDHKEGIRNRNKTEKKNPCVDLGLTHMNYDHQRRTRKTKPEKRNTVESNTGESNAESNTAVAYELRPRKRRSGTRRGGRRSDSKEPSQNNASIRSHSSIDKEKMLPEEDRPSHEKRPSMSEMIMRDMVSSLDKGMLQDEPAQEKRPSMSEMVMQDMISRGLFDDEDEESSEDEDDSVESDHDEVVTAAVDDDSDCWSESLRADLKSPKSQHTTKKLASSVLPSSTVGVTWPNLRRSMTPEQRQLGISDHGTIHDMDSDGDSSMDNTMYSGGSSSTSLEYDSGRESSKSSAESESESSFEQESLTNHSLSSRIASMILLSPIRRSQSSHGQSLPETLQQLENNEEVPALEESPSSSHSSIIQSTSNRRDSYRSVSSAEVTAKRNQVQNKLEQLDAHMLKVFGKQSAPELSETTRNMIRDHLTGSSNQYTKTKDIIMTAANGYRISNKSIRRESQLYHIGTSHSATSLSFQASSRHQDTMLNHLLQNTSSKSTSDLSSLEAKRSNAELSRRKLREAFHTRLSFTG